MGNCVGRRSRERSADGAAYARVPDSDAVADPPPPYEVASSVSDEVQQRLLRMTDEERFQFVRRMTLMQMLPVGTYSLEKGEKRRECVICMQEFVVGESIRLLPCMHLYHQSCIDDWLTRQFSCPFCMEGLDTILTESVEEAHAAATA
ncbi:RING finger protein 11-like [Sycon ciliatum]|uniref:RING finger protein 11-like n=1 Tax=Sycon ciliatum TaxID=27933 RepID=UPI0020A8C3A2|eukprot:scpid96704/ scgid30820/ RING finger protein 11 &gt; RING finger protein 11